jgi:putative cell wall-binding protein
VAGSIPAASYVCIVLNKTPPLALQPYFANTNLVPNGTVSVGSASGAVVGNSGALTQIGGLYSAGRTVTDGAITGLGSKNVASAMANFTSAADVGRTVTGTGIPAGATIASVTNATTIVLSAATPALQAATTGVTLTFGNLGSLTQSTGFSFQVTTASTTAGTFTVSGLSVVGVLSPGNGTLTVYASSSAACTTANATYTTNTTAYSAFNANRIYGQVADGTAAALLESVFKPAGTTCPTGGNVVLATDQNFPDALSASYLAQGLKTGVLLTPTGSLSTDAAAALRVEGITHVYIVGGPIAVSTDVVNQLTATQAYNCGGTTGLITAAPGTPQNLTVTQVYGQTAYDTAQSVAQYFGASGVGSGSFATAYPTSTTGTSTYNATSGMSGTIAPANSAPTKVAIVATGENFPDAVAASALVYAQAWPVLLTQQASLAPQAAAAISNLGIQQVVVMGGPIAISDAVVTQLEGMGVSVLRIGGQDYTDTAQLLAQFELNSNGLNWSTTYPNLLIPLTYGVNVARGDFYADALAGSVVGGKTHTPIVLTFDPNTMGTGIPALLKAEASLKIQVTSLSIFGGPLAVSAPTQLSVLLSISANSTV